MRAVSALLALQLLTGCSLVLTRAPRYVPERPEVPAECTESRAAPIADAVVAGALFAAAGGLIAWGASARNGEAGMLRITSSLAPLSYGTMEGFVAVAGFQRARACERIRAAQLRCLAGEGAACAALQADAFAPRLAPSPSGSAPRP